MSAIFSVTIPVYKYWQLTYNLNTETVAMRSETEIKWFYC